MSVNLVNQLGSLQRHRQRFQGYAVDVFQVGRFNYFQLGLGTRMVHSADGRLGSLFHGRNAWNVRRQTLSIHL